MAFVELLFLLENLEEIELAEGQHGACVMCVLQDLLQPSGAFFTPDFFFSQLKHFQQWL